jgi:CSLREA domain-containing protein
MRSIERAAHRTVLNAGNRLNPVLRFGWAIATSRVPSNCYGSQSAAPRLKRLFAALLLFAAISATPANAAVFAVDTTADVVDDNIGDGICATAGGDCTLRAAIQEANSTAATDTVNLNPGTYTLTIAGDGENAAATGDLDVTEDLVINGSNAGATIVDGNALDRIFENYAPLLTISRLMIRNGLVNAEGGGIRVHGANSLTLNKVTISDNDVFDKKGGAIVLSSGTLSLTNVTLSGNSAKEGGALHNSSGTVFMTNVSIAANTATSKGAGIVPGSGSFTVANTIIANNDAVPDCDSSIGPGTNNLDGDGSCGFGLTADPLLGPLQDNGGSSHTHALPIGSPAIDTGDNAVCVAPANDTDQRNLSRPYDGDGDTVATCDIGAFESQTAPVQISGTVSEDVNADANLGDAVGRPSVGVSLYLDDGDNVPDAGDALSLSTTTDATGAFTLSPVGAGTYWVVVDSQTVTPSAGLNAPFTADHAWAEQTYGPAGGWCADGAGGSSERGSAGPCYAGRLASTSDDASALITAEHIARVTVAAADVNNVDFAFSYNAVTNTSAGVQAAANARSAQGSVDQFLANANAVAGANTLRFAPALAPDDGTGDWWRIDYTAAAAALESIYDASTIVDGTAYCAWDDGTQGCAAVSTVRNTNTAVLGAAQTVGVSGLFTTPTCGATRPRFTSRPGQPV